jgi:hypothetical protein
VDERRIRRKVRALIERVTAAHLAATDEELRNLLYPDWVELIAGIYREEALEEGLSTAESEAVAAYWRELDPPDQLKGPFPPLLDFEEICGSIRRGREAALRIYLKTSKRIGQA